MESPIKPLLVPYDFTNVADNALLHAVKFANSSGSDIILLHVVKKDEDTEAPLRKLEKVAEEIYEKYRIETDAVVREGTIFATVKEFAHEIDAIMAIMGTHGIKGMQKFTGSWALKVIEGSKIPFVVVQDRPGDEVFNNIVFPMDFNHENKEKLRWANFLSHFYDTKIHISSPKLKDERFRQRTISNVKFAKKYMEDKGISYEIRELPGKHSFAHETIEFAKETKADLIMIMTTKYLGFTQYLFGAEEQKIIANEEHIPVMCVNPRKDLRRAGAFKTTGG